MNDKEYMKKRYCTNIDKCLAFPLILPVGFLIFLTFIFLITFVVALAKGELTDFFGSIVNSWALWLYLSGPISLAVSILVSACLIIFPICYIDVRGESIRIHNCFKKDIVIRYDEIAYVKFYSKQKELALSFFTVIFGDEINTVEICKKMSNTKFMLSSSRRAYETIAREFQNACGRNIR